MGYYNEDAPGHEGHVALLFADGEQSASTSGHGVQVWPGGGPGKVGDINREETRPYADITHWQVQCECGWSGRKQSLADELPECVAAGWYEPTDEREEMLMDEWRRHIRPQTITSEVRSLAAELDGVSGRLAHAVMLAKEDGASWADLGDALGMTRQGAQQRYGHLG